MAKKKKIVLAPVVIDKFDSVQQVAYVPRDEALNDRLKERIKIQEQLKKEAVKAAKKK